MKGQDKLFASGNDEWETNPTTFIRLHEEFDFEVDACASDTNALLAYYFTKARSALVNAWRVFVPHNKNPYTKLATRFFMNPPYSETDAFMQAAHDNAVIQRLLVVCLVASRTDTKWWHRLVWDEDQNTFRKGVSVRFLRGRETFYENGEPRKTINKAGKLVVNSAPFPSVVVIFDFRDTK